MYTRETELFHYGVKGMKWGKRKARLENKVEKRFARVGKYQGKAAFARSKADEAERKYTDDADVLDRQAKAWEQKGHVIAAEVARRRSAKLRAKGAEARAEFDQEADWYTKQAAKSQEKASKYATKKRVDLGKSRIDSILSTSKQKSYDRAKASYEYNKEFDEWEAQNRPEWHKWRKGESDTWE